MDTRETLEAKHYEQLKQKKVLEVQLAQVQQNIVYLEGAIAALSQPVPEQKPILPEAVD